MPKKVQRCEETKPTLRDGNGDGYCPTGKVWVKVNKSGTLRRHSHQVRK